MTTAQIVVQMPDWDEALWLTEWSKGANGWTCAPGKKSRLSAYPEDIYRGMMVGLRDYVGRNGFPGVLLGLSGGIDSALCAAIAVDALGADKLWCVMLPMQIYQRRQSGRCRRMRRDAALPP